MLGWLLVKKIEWLSVSIENFQSLYVKCELARSTIDGFDSLLAMTRYSAYSYSGE